MKLTKKMILTFALLLFMIIGTVNAESTQEEPFKFDWSKDQKSTITNHLTNFDIPFNSTIAFKEGYVNVDVSVENYPVTRINYYNFKGKKIATNIVELGVVFYITSLDNHIYTLNYDLDYDLYELVKYDEELDEVASIELPEEVADGLFYPGFFIEKTYKDGIVSNKNNEITIGTEDFFYHFDKNLKSYEIEETTDNLIEKYYPEAREYYYLTAEIDVSHKHYASFDINNNNKILGGNISTCSSTRTQQQQSLKGQKMTSFDSTVKMTPCPIIGIIEVYDNNNKLILNKEFEEYEAITNVRFVDQYIVATGYISADNYYESKSEILVFDMSGNLLQKISDNKSQYLLITPSESGFTINKFSGRCRLASSTGTSISETIGKMKDMDTQSSECEMSLEAYYLPRNIETKVTGEGTINVVDKARSGEEITYEVTPKEGYVLDTIKVTDASGNIVEYKTNTFTMPSADVTIEVTFKKDILNPDTKDMALIVLVLALALGLGTLLINYKKLRFLK